MKARVGAAVVCALLAAGCERQMHDMYRQPRFDPDQASTMWPDGRADRPPVPGTVPAVAGDIAGTSSGRRSETMGPAQPPVTKMLLERGQQRYSIYWQATPARKPA